MSTQPEPKFRPGDIVRFRGGQDEWTLVGIPCHPEDSLLLDNKQVQVGAFREDVELVRRPKRKVKLSGWVNIYSRDWAPRRNVRGAYRSQDEANLHATKGRTACVQIEWEEEVEGE